MSIYELQPKEQQEKISQQYGLSGNLAQDQNDFLIMLESQFDRAFIELSVPLNLSPSQEMTQIVATATQTPTTLWFDSDKQEAEKQLRGLIACGQLTMCFNLLKYVDKVSKTPNTNFSPAMQTVYDQALAAWKKLEQQPDALVDRDRFDSKSI